jgi:two-component system LytT family response regulator
MILLAFADIVWLEGAGNYTYIHTRDNRRYLSSKTLKRLEPELVGPAFCRVHKSTIINMAYLSEINFGTAPHLYLKNNQLISISRRRLPATRRQVKSYQKLAGIANTPVA